MNSNNCKKIITVFLVLCMVFSIFGIGKVLASAERRPIYRSTRNKETKPSTIKYVKLYKGAKQMFIILKLGIIREIDLK